MHTNRFYRKWVQSDLTGFEVKVEETDLFILADKKLENEAENSIKKHRNEIEGYIKINPEFNASLKPVKSGKNAPQIIKRMVSASNKVKVGPMAGIAGAMSEFVGKELLKFSKEVIVENGGDIFIKSLKDRTFNIYAGDSPLSGKINIKIKAKDTPLGVCTSSGTVGHSLSFGLADSVTVISKDAILSDNAATAICNVVKKPEDIKKGLELSKKIEGVLGCVIIYNDKMGSMGKVELA